MTTARDICTLALQQAGVTGFGVTPSAEDISATFTLMQQMIAQWQKKRWLVPSLQKLAETWNGQKSNTIGPGGFYNVERPNQIKAAYVVQLNTGSNPVSIPLIMIPSFEDYSLISLKDMPSLPTHFFYDGQFPLGNLYVWPVASSQYEIHIVIESLLGFGTTIGAGSITTGGAAYTNGNYLNVELTGGSGEGATADITVTAGAIAVVNLLTGGEDYVLGDVLGVAAADVGGTGAGFTWTVSQIVSNIDTEIVMPPEYEEALQLNLAIRVGAFYQIEANADTRRLAKSALNTIRVANTQVPTLSMPMGPGLRKGKAFNIYNADGY